MIAGIAVAALVAGLLTLATRDEGPDAGPARPNVVVVMTDDQTLEELRVMDNVLTEIGEAGVTFNQQVTNYPLCCPSRTTFLTGQYAHNHGVLSNSGKDGGFRRFEELHGDDNLATWLQSAGYQTGIVGKYLNLYKGPEIPPGWDTFEVSPFPTDQDAYDYEMFDENGALISYGDRAKDFKQDVITERSVEFVDRAAKDGNPFFLWASYSAPHGVPQKDLLGRCNGAAHAAPRHVDAFRDQSLPDDENLNEADVSDKPAYVRDAPLLDERELKSITREYQCALGSLLSVDEGVAKIIDALDEAGVLDETYVAFTSDNGLSFGQHRQAETKINPYEESIRVPLLIRGPGIPAGVELDQQVSNADLPAMITQVTGATGALETDGRSLLDTIADPASGDDRALLIEADKSSLGAQFGDLESLQYKAVRTSRYMYVEHLGGEVELYDLEADPLELLNIADDPDQAKVTDRLAGLLDKLVDCAGPDCLLDAPPALTASV